MADRSEVNQFFESLAPHFDTTSPLRWGFLLDGASEERVDPLMAELSALGFVEIEAMFDDENPGKCILGFGEVCVHSAESFARRVESVEGLAAREGLQLSDYSAGLADA